ncbi:MAG TPA: replicative DNA helicase [Candidatus Dormibacteraeota bacterium]|nr:replicative DNA helicase [Candidatus Dormibacteraeota bacterium]
MATTLPLAAGRIPPHDLDAEISILGSILLDPLSIAKVLQFLHPEDFYRENNGQMYRAALDLFAAGEPIDNITLASQLQTMGLLERVGGRAQLASMQSIVPTAANIEYYGRIVKEKAYKRRLISAGGNIAGFGYDDSIEAEDAINQAQSLVFGVADDRDQRELARLYDLLGPAMERISVLMESGQGVVGIPSGFHDLDRMTGGFKDSDLIIVAGRPSMGKTSLALNLGLYAALEAKKSVAIFSLEMSKEQLTERLLTEQAQIDAQRMHRGLLTEAEFDRVSNALGPLGEAQIYIDDTPVMDELTLQLKARQAKMRHKVDMILIDYLQLMHGRAGGDDNRVQEVSSISRSMKGLARELRIPVIALSQLSRAPEQRPDKRPILSDLRESGCLAGETPIYLPDTGTYVPIRELVGKTGFRVLALDEGWWRLEPRVVTNAFATGTKPVLRLTTRLGRSVRATANHKFLTMRGWRRLDELSVGDHIAVPRILQGPDVETMTDAELGLLGHLIGDGCTLPKHAIQYTTKDSSLADEVVRLADAVFGDEVRPRIRHERNWIQVYLPATRHLTHGVHNPIRVWLEALGVFGLRSWEKRVPERVFQQSALGIACFLRHLWATDGSVHLSRGVAHYANVYYASSSEHLARDVQSLLIRIGINARLSRHSQGRKGRDQFHVQISGQHDISVFLEVVGALGQNKTAHRAAILEYLGARRENTNRDVIPSDVWRSFIVPAMKEAQLTTRALYKGIGTRYAGTSIYTQNLSRTRARKAADVVRSPELELLATSDVYWDKIHELSPDGEEEVFDLTVDGLHNFAAGNVVAHNSIEQDADVVMFLFRPEYYKSDEKPGIAEVIVAKHRNGPTGTIELKFRRDHTRFYNLETRRPEPGAE